MLECKGGVLYIGIAKDVEARFASHLDGSGAKFARLHPPLRVLAKVALETRGEALRAEYALKQCSRTEKLRWCKAGLAGFLAESTAQMSK